MGITFIDTWLIAEGLDSGRWYVIHTQNPRFILEMTDTGFGYESGDFILIDECFDADVMARFAREAGEAMSRYDDELGVE